MLGDIATGLWDGEGVECVETVSEKATSDGRSELRPVVDSLAFVSAAACSIVPVWWFWWRVRVVRRVKVF